MKITLDSGIEIELYELIQKLTYEGLIEGLPTKKMNASIVKHSVDRHSSGNMKTYLIEPVETPIEIKRDYPFGEPARLPSITCVARFESDYSRKEPFLYRTTAKVIWFQSDFALPIEEEILEIIRSVDWPNASTEYEV